MIRREFLMMLRDEAEGGKWYNCRNGDHCGYYCDANAKEGLVAHCNGLNSYLGLDFFVEMLVGNRAFFLLCEYLYMLSFSWIIADT